MKRTKTLKSFFLRNQQEPECIKKIVKEYREKQGGQRAKHSHSHSHQREISGNKILLLMKYERRGQTKPSLVSFFYHFHVFIKYAVDLSMELRYHLNLCIYELG